MITEDLNSAIDLLSGKCTHRAYIVATLKGWGIYFCSQRYTHSGIEPDSKDTRFVSVFELTLAQIADLGFCAEIDWRHLIIWVEYPE